MKLIQKVAILSLTFLTASALADPIAMSPTSLTAKNLFDDPSQAAFPLPSDVSADKQAAFCSAYSAEAVANCNKVSPNPNICKNMKSIIAGQEFQINTVYHQATLDQNISKFCKGNAPKVGQTVEDCNTDTWTLMNYSYDAKCGWK
jgi:hypothetical protein